MKEQKKGKPNMKMDITLVSTYGLSRPGFMPVSVLYLASALKRAGYRADIRDYQFYTDNIDPFPGSFLELMENSSDIIGISSLCDTLPLVITAAQAIKKKWPGKLIMLGGPAVSPLAEKLLERFPFIDIIVRGEGEDTIVKTMDSLSQEGQNLSNIRGISYRRGKKIFRNPESQRIKNPDSLLLDYSLIDMKSYDYFTVLTTRGCPYQCSFCASCSYWGYSVTERSIARVLDEVELLVREYEAWEFGILDDLFTSSPQRVSEFCQGLKQRDIDTPWQCTSRIDLVSEDLLAELSQAGCHRLVFGIESAVPEILEKTKKGTIFDQAVQAVRMALQYDIAPAISFIWGWPFEDLQAFYRTMLLADSLGNIDPRIRIDLNLLSPYQPSEISYTYRDFIVQAIEDFTTMTAIKGCIPKHPDSRALVFDLVNEHKDLFVSFSRFDTPDFKKKAAFIRRFQGKLGHGLINQLMAEFKR